MLGLTYVAGAAAMYFGLPTSKFLWQAFAEVDGWLDARHSDNRPTVIWHKPDAVADGYTLITDTLTATARLIDMQGHVVHQWRMKTLGAWTRPQHVRGMKFGEPVYWERCYVYPNGDLLALCSNSSEAPYGYALIKLNKESQLLWSYAGNVHHDVTVAEDGRIYVLCDSEGVRSPADSWIVPDQFMSDQLVILSPEGKQLESIALLEVIEESPYAVSLLSGPGFIWSKSPAPPRIPNRPPPPGNPAGAPLPPDSTIMPTDASQIANEPPPAEFSIPDLFHANSVKVLSAARAAKFPLFKAGQILISLRGPSALIMLDPQTRQVVWAARGPWLFQHDAHFLDNGRLLFFDNFGSPVGARVLEYDPVTQAIDWWYGGKADASFTSTYRGGCQRLPNGNTLIVDAMRNRVFEVTADKDIAWEWFGRGPTAPIDVTDTLTYARRYTAAELPFLKGQ